MACATARQQEELYGRLLASAATRLLQFGGAAGLLAVLAWLVHSQGWGMGLVMFSGHTSLAAGMVLGALVVIDRQRTRR